MGKSEVNLAVEISWDYILSHSINVQSKSSFPLLGTSWYERAHPRIYPTKDWRSHDPTKSRDTHTRPQSSWELHP